MLLRMWNNWNSHPFPVAMQNDIATLANSSEVSCKVKYITYHSTHHVYWFLSKKVKTYVYRKTCI